MEERKLRFANKCREGNLEISFPASGAHIHLGFNSNPMMYHHQGHLTSFDQGLDFNKEQGKVRNENKNSSYSIEFELNCP